jgi:hypothetical protein
VRIGASPVTDAGAAMLETALVTPLLALLLLAVFDGSLAWRDHAAATDAVAAGARVAALHPTDRLEAPTGDLDAVISVVRDSLAGTPAPAVERLVIYAPEPGPGAASSVERVPVGCRHGSQPGLVDQCLVIDPAVVRGDGGGWLTPTCTGGPHACPWRRAWSSGIPRQVGVYLRLRRVSPLAGIAPGATVEVAAVAALEAGRAD